MSVFHPDNDGFLLQQLLAHRRLSARQLQWLTWAHTSTCRDRQVIRRRMRGALSHLGLVQVLRQHSRTQEVSYALAAKGYEYVAAVEGVEVSELPVHRGTQATAPQSYFYRHYSHVVDLAIALELACRAMPDQLQMEPFIHEWLVANPQARSKGRHFVLARSFQLGSRSHLLRPDGAATLCFPALGGFRATYLVELERGTNWGRRIDRKYEQYFAAFLSSDPLSHLGPAAGSTFFVLFIVQEGPRRAKIELMRRKLADFAARISGEASRTAFLKRFRFAALQDALTEPRRISSREVVLTQNILTAPIWQRWDGQMRSLYRERERSAA